MRSILVANPKGGAGKTTLATNVSAALAKEGDAVTLWDLDKQKSSLAWLGIRSSSLPRIDRLTNKAAEADQPPKKKGWLVLDSPAGLHGKTLAQAMRIAEKILVPVQPSLFDMAATGEFLRALVDEKAVRKRDAVIGIIGMRVDPRTRAASTLEAFLSQFELPVLTYLRDTQMYANAAFNGMGVFDLPEYQSARDVEQWQPVLRWLNEGNDS